MGSNRECEGGNDYVRRLPPAFYRGQAYIHWSMNIADRRIGWLTPVVHSEFRELLTHTMFRYSLCCPIYCCMPDHIHQVWLGISDGADQRNAAKFFRTHFNQVLEPFGVRL